MSQLAASLPVRGRCADATTVDRILRLVEDAADAELAAGWLFTQEPRRSSGSHVFSRLQSVQEYPLCAQTGLTTVHGQNAPSPILIYS